MEDSTGAVVTVSNDEWLAGFDVALDCIYGLQWDAVCDLRQRVGHMRVGGWEQLQSGCAEDVFGFEVAGCAGDHLVDEFVGCLACGEHAEESLCVSDLVHVEGGCPIHQRHEWIWHGVSYLVIGCTPIRLHLVRLCR